MNYNEKSKSPFTIISNITTEGKGVQPEVSMTSFGVNERDAAINFIAGNRFCPVFGAAKPEMVRGEAARYITRVLGENWTIADFEGKTFESVDGYKKFEVVIMAEGADDDSQVEIEA